MFFLRQGTVVLHVFTGSIARGISYTERAILSFLPCRGDMLHRWGEIWFGRVDQWVPVHSTRQMWALKRKILQ